MTLELARKRRDQGDLICELVGAIEGLGKAILNEVNADPNLFLGKEMDDALRATHAVLKKAKEHDCIPWDDAKEVAQQ